MKQHLKRVRNVFKHLNIDDIDPEDVWRMSWERMTTEAPGPVIDGYMQGRVFLGIEVVIELYNRPTVKRFIHASEIEGSWL